MRIGTGRTADKVKGYWPIFTADGSLAVHYEHDVLITADDPRVLTDGLDMIQDIVG